MTTASKKAAATRARRKEDTKYKGLAALRDSAADLLREWNIADEAIAGAVLAASNRLVGQRITMNGHRAQTMRGEQATIQRVFARGKYLVAAIRGPMTLPYPERRDMDVYLDEVVFPVPRR